MPRGSNTAVFTGPWMGMEERENYQTDGHCQLALNVDFNRGYIESRPGFKRLRYGSGFPAKARLHVHRVNGEPKYILAVGLVLQTEKSDVVLQVLDANDPGSTFETVQNLSTGFGEPEDRHFECSFVSSTLTRADLDGNKTIPHHVTLITTKHRTYIFDPLKDSTAVEAADMTDGPIQLNSLNWGYWNNVPSGRIATEHQSRVYYAGFPDHFMATLTSPLDELQSLVPEAMINQQDRGQMLFGPQFIAWSDEFDPLGIAAYHFLAVEEHERVTGLKSFQEQLVIFTDRSIYVKTGGTDETFQVFKVVSDVGCVAPKSIVEVGGVLMFMARDGIYVFSGAGQQGGVEKLSKPIDSIFTGQAANTYVPEKARSGLYNRGWPFAAKKQSLRFSNALHVQGKNQVWWSVDLEGTRDQSWELTLVFDYAHQAWSVYGHGVASTDPSAGVSPMYDGVTVALHGNERVFVSTADGAIMEHTGTTDSDTDSSGTRGVPLIYISGRMFKESTSVDLYRPIRLKILSYGASGRLTDPPFWMAYGEEAHADSQYVDTAGAVQNAASADRQYTEGEIPLHPAEDSNFFYGVGTYSGGAKDITYQDTDWFTSKIESASIRSRSLRMAFMGGYSASDDRSGELVVQSIAVEVAKGESR